MEHKSREHRLQERRSIAAEQATEGNGRSTPGKAATQMTKRQNEMEIPTPGYPTTERGVRPGSARDPSSGILTDRRLISPGGTTASTFSGGAGGTTGPAGSSSPLESVMQGQLAPPSQHGQVPAMSHRSVVKNAPAGITREIWSTSPSRRPTIDRRVMGLPLAEVERIQNTNLASRSTGPLRVDVRRVSKPLEKLEFFAAHFSEETF